MNRRLLLATAGSMVGGLTAGCSTLLSNNYSYNLHNNSRKGLSFNVRLENTSSDIIHNETRQLEGGMGKEGIAIEGVPARIILGIDSSERTTVPWPASTTEEGEISTHADVDYDIRGQEELQVVG